MEKISLRKENGQIVPCVAGIPEDPAAIAIVVHGFTSSKESATVRMLLRVLPSAGIGVAAIDLPAHGTEEAREEVLRTEACLDSIAAAEEWVASRCPGKKICYFGSSFGAYCIGLYISTRPHLGRNAFFRSAAVNMPSLFIKEHPNEAEQRLMDELEEKGYIQPSFDLGSPVTVTKAFIEDLRRNDLFALFSPDKYGPHFIAMAHGTADATIDPEEAKRFAGKYRIPVTFFEGEGHSLSGYPGTPEKVGRLAADWFLSH